MKTIKSFLFILVLLISVNFHASPESVEARLKVDPFRGEIAKILSRSSLIIEEDFTARVFFTLSEDKVINIRSISSSNAVVNNFLQLRLNGQQLKGSNWQSGKVYELPVRLKAIR